jgi:ABC-type transport system involved in multi-copper enzyme maturation permease subunit
MNILRIWAIAVNGFREVIREKILYIIGLFALFMLAAWRLLPEVSATTESKIIVDFGLALIHILSVIVTVFVGTGLINKEIEKRTVLVLIPKPITHAEFIIGKHLGLGGVLTVLVSIMTVIYFAVLTVTRIEFPANSIMISLVFLILELLLISAVALLFGVFTSSVLATLLTFAVYFVGHLSQDIVKLGEISKNPSLQNITEKMYLILPDLSRLDLKNQAVYNFLPTPDKLIENAGFGIIYTVLMLCLTILIFSRRQF